MLAVGAAVFAFWLILTASLAPADLALGAALSLLLGWWSARFLWAGQAPRVTAGQLLALLGYLLRLGGQVFLAALHVARVVMDPRLPISPRLVVCQTRLKQPVSRVVFANSVTLTPGTLTVDLDGGSFLVHCLDRASAESLLDGELERRIARVFEHEDAP
jgi:multicomponent Na+:H+ antiporter subunit E